MTTPYWPETAAVALDDWGASATATEGNPHMSGKVLSVNPDGSSECGVWSCTPGTRAITIPSDEFCYFLGGKGVYVHENGEEIPVSAGAAVFFPAGWTGTSIITETLTKAFMSRGD
ncbi:cupin domain-containing protein [Mycoplana rhizolycopersici]|uniref:Cupin domain-containing protein n=1 Tax=Mycoplana rhizolycopersici TaxID=2746702 RepID=A0ABX2QCC4_9HYPH|nr:cupin domain-containing protein [Rhizobium rhizolycopersici]NVP55305.1 cupin domain-containing protein [Rhizobium rhizolycopersici]